MSKAFDTGGAIPDDDDDDTDTDNQQVAGNIPPAPAGPGGDQPATTQPFAPNPPLQPGQNPFGKRADSGAIPEGAADDQTTASLDDALNTVDSVMQYGYQQNGIDLSGQQQASAIPMSPAGPGGDQPNQNPFPTKTPAIPFGKRADATDSSPGDVQAMDDGGEVMPSAPISGQLPPVQDQHASDMTGVYVDAAKRAKAATTKKSSGTQSYDDGGSVEGAIPEQPGDDTSQQQQPSMMNRVGGALQSLPQPAPGGQQGISKIVGLVQGAGAMPPQQALQLEKQSGETDPNVAKIKTAAALAQSGGPEAAWSYMQSLRKQFDTARTAAAVKASMGALPQSTQAANIAMSNVLDGTDTKFQPAPNGKGVVLTIKKLNRGGSKGYAEGGAISTDDATMSPDDVQGPDDSSSGSSIGKFVLSIPQYFQMLMGKEGQYDSIYNNGVAGAAKKVAEGQGMQPPPSPDQGQDATNAMTYAQSVSGAVNTGAPNEMSPAAASKLGGQVAGAVGNAASAVVNPAGGMVNSNTDPFAATGPQPQNPSATTDANGNGATQTTPPTQPSGGTMGAAAPVSPPPQRQGGQQQAAPATPGQSGQTDETDHEAMERIYGKDAVKAAELANPMVSQGPQRMAQLQGERGEQMKAAAQQANTRILAEGRANTATIRAGSVLSAAQIRAAASNQSSQNRLFGVMEGIAAGQRNNSITNIARGLEVKTASGQPLSDNEVAWIQRLIAGNNAQPQQQQGGGQQARPQAVTPMKDYTQTPGVAQVQQGQTRTVLVNNKPYIVDAGGKVLGPAQ